MLDKRASSCIAVADSRNKHNIARAIHNGGKTLADRVNVFF